MTRPDPKPERRVRDREVLRRFHRLGRECGSCGHGVGVEAHHIVSRAQGGDDVLANLFPLCAGCHGAIHGQPYTAYGVRVDARHVRHAIAAFIRSEAGDDARNYLYRKLEPPVFGAEAFVQRLER